MKYMETEDFISMIPLGHTMSITDINKTVDDFNKGLISYQQVKNIATKGFICRAHIMGCLNNNSDCCPF